MMIDCIQKVRDKQIIFSEKKSRFEIKNPQQREIAKYEVDGCIFNTNEFKKCDWLAIDMLSKREIYIELKGKDADKDAIAQIAETVEKLSKNQQAIKYGYIIHTSSLNPETDTTHQRMVKSLKKSHQIIIRFRKTPHTELIDDLIK